MTDCIAGAAALCLGARVHLPALPGPAARRPGATGPLVAVATGEYRRCPEG